MMRAGFKAVLEATGNIEVVAEAATARRPSRPRRARARRRAHGHPHAGMDGIEATRRLPRQRVLILTTFGLDEYIIDALRAGASGFLLKDAPTPRSSPPCGRSPPATPSSSPAVTRQLLDQVGRRLPAAVSRTPASSRALTEREQQVLRMLAAGLTNAEISEALVLSEADGQDPRLEPARQARPARPRPGRDLRLRDGAHRAG
jgi:DNA-binding NarL/FixJ family response regulator